MLNPRERREITAEITKASEDTVQASHRQSSASTSHNSEDIDSAESADSRTQVCYLGVIMVGRNGGEKHSKLWNCCYAATGTCCAASECFILKCKLFRYFKMEK